MGIQLIPDSFGVELAEFNSCHGAADGKFCSTAGTDYGKAQVVSLGQRFDIVKAASAGVEVPGRGVNRRFLFNPETGELVLGAASGVGENGHRDRSHAEALEMAGRTPDQYDNYLIHGYFQTNPAPPAKEGPFEVVIDRLINKGYEADHAARIDHLDKFSDRLSALGAPKAVVVLRTFGLPTNLGKRDWYRLMGDRPFPKRPRMQRNPKRRVRESALREKWGPAAWKASAEARRRKAGQQHVFNDPVRKPFLQTDLDITDQQTLGKRKVIVYPTMDTWRASNVQIERPRDGARAGITLGTEGERSAVLSALRHERGHVTSAGEEERPAAQRLLGQQYEKRYAKEVLAWRDAVKNAPFNRVEWRVVQDVLTKYLEDDSYLNIRAALAGARVVPRVRALASEEAARHVAALKRYGRKLRLKDTTPPEARPSVFGRRVA